MHHMINMEYVTFIVRSSTQTRATDYSTTFSLDDSRDAWGISPGGISSANKISGYLHPGECLKVEVDGSARRWTPSGNIKHRRVLVGKGKL